LIATLAAQSPPLLDAAPLYQQLRNASIPNKSVRLENLVLERDRVPITFTELDPGLWIVSEKTSAVKR
jgi:hypothetical protein